MAPLRVLNVGCGNGKFLRQLIDWGADPANLTGTELLPDRLDTARRNTAGDVRWHLGELDSLPDGSFDLVSAHTVFSSILDDAARQRLANGMWRRLRPGGWCLVFDFRYNNPRNRQVRSVTRSELAGLWPARQYDDRRRACCPGFPAWCRQPWPRSCRQCAPISCSCHAGTTEGQPGSNRDGTATPAAYQAGMPYGWRRANHDRLHPLRLALVYSRYYPITQRTT
jgi:SAM-dependent methyltransferase